MATVQPYQRKMLTELDDVDAEVTHLLEMSSIERNDWPEGFIGFPRFSWQESTPAAQRARMALLAKVEDLEPRFRLLFPHPTPEIEKVLKESFSRLRRWTKRGKQDHSIPGSIAQAKEQAADAVTQLKALTDMLPADSWPIRVVVDTNTLLDNPDVAAYKSVLGDRYMVHLMPVVLGELDDLKRSGRNPELREAAQRASRRLKGLRDNGDVSAGARVQGNVFVVFEHTEPGTEGLPAWLDLEVPDDRLVAATLLLQSAHPASAVYLASGDLNLQTKLAAVGLPHIELPT